MLARAFILVLLLAASADAKDYGPKGNTELIFLGDWQVDLEVRMALFRQAKTIDFVTFSQNTDGIGLPILDAMRQGQISKGTKVRGIYDWQVSLADKNQGNYVKALLTDPSLSCPGEVLCAHPIEKLSSGVGLMDYIHQKITILDAGTPNEIIFFSGRGTTASSSSYIDSGYLIRRIDPSRPYAGDDIRELYESIWSQLRKLAEDSVYPIPTRATRPIELPKPKKVRFAKELDHKARVAEILNHLRAPPPLHAAEGSLKEWEFRPEKMTVLSNELYAQLIAGKVERSAFFNDNHAKLVEEIGKFSGTLEMTAYSFGPSPELHEALVGLLKRGGTVRVYTNAEEGFLYANAGFRKGFPAYYSYESMLRLMKDAGPGAKIDFRLLDTAKAVEAGYSGYVHKKQVLFVETGVAYIGSDNFTDSAAKKNDEMLVRVENPRFSRTLGAISDEEGKVYRSVDRAGTQALWKKRPFWYGCLRSFVKTTF